MNGRSKIILVLGSYFVVSPLFAASTNVARLWQMPEGQLALWLLSLVLMFGVGIGLVMHRRWAMWLYFVQAPLALFQGATAPSIHELEPSRRITAQVIIILIVLVPAVLIWIRRDRLGPLKAGSPNA